VVDGVPRGINKPPRAISTPTNHRLEKVTQGGAEQFIGSHRASISVWHFQPVGHALRSGLDFCPCLVDSGEDRPLFLYIFLLQQFIYLQGYIY